MIWQRILTGFLAVPLLIAMAFDDGWLFRLGLLAFGLLGTAETLWMAHQAGYRPLRAFSYIVALGVLADATLSHGQPFRLPVWADPALLAPGQVVGPALGVAVLGSLALLLIRSDHRGSLNDWALTLALPLYVAGLLQFFVPLRFMAGSGILTWPAMVLATSWACDIAAFVVGGRIGRTRLAPLISPAKSVEGALAGLLAAMMAGVLFSLWTQLNPFLMAGFGLVVGIGSIVGDLAESLLKRQCGVKDSGFMMPGHGGILDRMDALIAAAACAYFYLAALR